MSPPAFKVSPFPPPPPPSNPNTCTHVSSPGNDEASQASSQLRRRKSVGRKGGDGNGTTAKKEEKITPQEAGLRSRHALSRILLKQGHDKLNLKGNFSNDSFNSLMDETTGLFTLFTVYEQFRETDERIYYAAITIYVTNALIRLFIGLSRVFSPALGTQLIRGYDGSIGCKTWLRVIAGMLLIILEPVAGVRLLDSAYEPAPPLTQAERDELEATKVRAINVEVEAAAKIKEANEKATKAATEQSKYKETEFNASELVAAKALYKRLADSRKQEVEVVTQEAAYLKARSPLTQEQADLQFVQADVDMQERSFRLEQKKLKGTELVEVVMAVFEDIPEIAVGVTFAAMGGLKEASVADTSLFVTSQVVSLFHAAKCFWSFWTLKTVIRDAKLAEEARVDTHGEYFSVRPIEEHGTSSPAGQRLAQRLKAIEPLKDESERVRREWDAEFKQIEEAIVENGSDLQKADLQKQKQDEADRKMRLKTDQKNAVFDSGLTYKVDVVSSVNADDGIGGGWFTQDGCESVEKIVAVNIKGPKAELLLAIVNDDYDKTLAGLEARGSIPILTRTADSWYSKNGSSQSSPSSRDVLTVVCCGHTIYHYEDFTDNSGEFSEYTNDEWWSFHGKKFKSCKRKNPKRITTTETYGKKGVDSFLDTLLLDLVVECGLGNAARAIRKFDKMLRKK